MVVDIFHHDTLQRVSNSPPPSVSFAISKEDKRRLIYLHLLAKMLVYSKGRKTLSCTDILRLAKNRLVINSVNYVFNVPLIIADSTFCIVFKVHQGHPTSIFGKYLFVRRFEIQNFQNSCCKISSLPASPRIFEHLKNGIIAHFKRIFTLKRSPRILGSLFSG